MKRIRIILLALIVLALAGCDMLSGIEERSPAPADTTPVPVPPLGGDVAPNQVPVMLYYRYNAEEYLVPCPVLLNVTNDQSIEQAVIERLIQGPGGGSGEYVALIDPDTRVSVEEKRGHLEVTLSQEYVDSMTDLPDPWNVNTESYERELLLRRKLALYSIVNTITEMGKFSRVMVQIDRGTGVSEKLTRSEAGFESMGARAVDPIGRDASLILTAGTSVSLALDALSDRDSGALGRMIAPRDADGTAAPLNDLGGLMGSRPTLIDYEIISDFSVMPQIVGGTLEQATVSVNATFRDAVGNVSTLENIPLRLLRDGGVWRVAYSSLDALVPTP